MAGVDLAVQCSVPLGAEAAEGAVVDFIDISSPIKSPTDYSIYLHPAAEQEWSKEILILRIKCSRNLQSLGQLKKDMSICFQMTRKLLNVWILTSVILIKAL